MDEQARLLRELAAEAEAGRSSGTDRLPALAVTGGKGGVGKTSMAVNLAVLLARMGLKILLVDCDLGLANADVLLGATPERTLHDVMLSDSPIGSAIIEDRSGLHFVPAASGRDELTRMSARQLRDLLGELQRAARGYDLLVLDMPAGIARETIEFLANSRLVLVVLTPDPTSLTDAYAQVKILEQRHPGCDIRVLVNQAGSHEEGVATYNRLRKVVQTYLDRDIGFLGQVPRDRRVGEAVRQRRPFTVLGDSPATQALKGAALRLQGEVGRRP